MLAGKSRVEYPVCRLQGSHPVLREAVKVNPNRPRPASIAGWHSDQKESIRRGDFPLQRYPRELRRTRQGGNGENPGPGLQTAVAKPFPLGRSTRRQQREFEQLAKRTKRLPRGNEKWRALPSARRPRRIPPAGIAVTRVIKPRSSSDPDDQFDSCSPAGRRPLRQQRLGRTA